MSPPFDLESEPPRSVRQPARARVATLDGLIAALRAVEAARVRAPSSRVAYVLSHQTSGRQLDDHRLQQGSVRCLPTRTKTYGSAFAYGAVHTRKRFDSRRAKADREYPRGSCRGVVACCAVAASTSLEHGQSYTSRRWPIIVTTRSTPRNSKITR